MESKKILSNQLNGHLKAIFEKIKILPRRNGNENTYF